MPGPQNGFDFGGVKVKRLQGIAPGIGQFVNTLVIFSSVQENITSVGFLCCPAQLKYPDQWMGIFKDTMNELLHPDTKKDN